MAYLRAQGHVWTWNQIEAALTLSSSVANEERRSGLGEKYNHVKYEKAVEGKGFAQVVDFANRFTQEKR